MANPFEKRATEYLRDDEAFLAVVTPEPLATFFKKPAKEERLYDRLTMIIGTPGSGKTTLARPLRVYHDQDLAAQSQHDQLQGADRHADVLRGDSQRPPDIRRRAVATRGRISGVLGVSVPSRAQDRSHDRIAPSAHRPRLAPAHPNL